MSFQDVLKKATEVLKQGGIIVYPTDTVWGIGCDAKNKEAVARIYTLKKRADAKSMLCLVSNVAMLERHISEVPDAAYDIIDLSENPTTIILIIPLGWLQI